MFPRNQVFCLKKLKTLTSSNYHRVKYFFLKFGTRFLLSNVNPWAGTLKNGCLAPAGGQSMVWFFYLKNSSSLRIEILNCLKEQHSWSLGWLFDRTYFYVNLWRPDHKYIKLQMTCVLFKLWTSNVVETRKLMNLLICI